MFVFMVRLSRLFLAKFNFLYFDTDSQSKMLRQNTFFFQNIFQCNFIYFESINYLNYNIFFSKRFFILSNHYLFSYKKFINFFYTFLQFNFKFLTLDAHYNFFNFIGLELTELLKFNYFFNVNKKFFKKQQFLFMFSRFVTSSNIRLIIVFDYEVYSNFLGFLSTMHLYLASFVLPTHSLVNLDFYIYKSSHFKSFEKLLYYSIFYNIYNIVVGRKLQAYKYNYCCKFSTLKLISKCTSHNKHLQPLIHTTNIYNH